MSIQFCQIYDLFFIFPLRILGRQEVPWESRWRGYGQCRREVWRLTGVCTTYEVWTVGQLSNLWNQEKGCRPCWREKSKYTTMGEYIIDKKKNDDIFTTIDSKLIYIIIKYSWKLRLSFIVCSPRIVILVILLSAARHCLAHASTIVFIIWGKFEPKRAWLIE